MPRILKLVEASGALEYPMERARAEAAKASDTLNALAASPHKEALELLTQVAVARVS